MLHTKNQLPMLSGSAFYFGGVVIVIVIVILIVIVIVTGENKVNS